MKRIVDRIAFLWSGQALVGYVLIIAGLVVAWEGFFKLRELWHQFAPYLPFSFPPDTAQRMQTALPFVFSTFVMVVGSICAVLMGISWFLSGSGGVIESRNEVRRPPVFDKPELVAESLRSSQPQYWRSRSYMLRALGSIWPRARFISPISYNMFRKLTISSVKVTLLGGLIALATYGLQMIPILLKKYANIDTILLVPSPAPLYFLIGTVLFLNAVIALTMLPFRRTNFVRTCENVPVRGNGDPRMFFALLEEAAKLLSGMRGQDQQPVRLRNGESPQIRGTLVENSPKVIRSFARPAGYLCLPLILLLLTMGFSRLIYFNRPVAPVPYADFLTRYFLDYLMEVFFGIGLIITGLYFSDWAGNLFDVRKYRSALVFCHTSRPAMQSTERSPEKKASREGISWTTDGDVDEQFVQWAREPEGGRNFRIETFWAEVISESEGAEGPRFLIKMAQSQSLDLALSRILALPFCVSFETSAPVCPAPQSQKEA
jgi:hypothetical protein